MEVAVIPGLSAHASQSFLIEYAAAVKDQVQQVFLVHEEDKPAETLKARLKEEGIDKVYYP